MTLVSGGDGAATAGSIGAAGDGAALGELGDAGMIVARCDGGGPAGIVTITRCISAGIASEAISTNVHAVICACGFRTRRSVKPSHTLAPSASVRRADSRSS